jgi:hypothetical protein
MTTNMIKVNEEFHMEYSEEINNALTDMAIKIGDCIKSMEPLEKYYALKMISEELESRVTLYSVMGTMLQEQKES